MHEHVDAGNILPNLIHVPRPEAAVHRAVALPKNEPRTAQLLRGVPAQLLRGVPERHLFERYAELDARVASQVLVWEEEELIRLLQILIEERHCVRGGADDSAMLAAEGFDGSRRVHVS